jgi:hypothetical protein
LAAWGHTGGLFGLSGYGNPMKERNTSILFYVAMYIFGAGLFLQFTHPRLRVETVITDFWRVYVYGAALIVVLVFIYRKI